MYTVVFLLVTSALGFYSGCVGLHPDSDKKGCWKTLNTVNGKHIVQNVAEFTHRIRHINEEVQNNECTVTKDIMNSLLLE